MDISNAILAKSDQLNASDLMGGPRTVTIVETREGNDEQRVVIVTDVFGKSRPFKPSKTVLRVLGGAWGTETDKWIGRSMTLYREPTVTWAGEEIGGIRISALSDIQKPIVFNLPTSKTKHSKSTITPLQKLGAPAQRDWANELKLAGKDLDALKSLGNAAIAAKADPAIVKSIRDAVTAASVPE